MQGTYQPNLDNWTLRQGLGPEGDREQDSLHIQTHQQTGKALEEGKEWENGQSSTSQAPQVANRHQKILGLVITSRAKLSAGQGFVQRDSASWKYRRPGPPQHIENHSVPWASMGTILRVLEHNIGNAPCFCRSGVAKGWRTQESLNKLGKKDHKVAADEGSVRNEALMSTVFRKVANTRSHWVIACDANMDPSEFGMGEWVEESRAKVKSSAARKRRLLC